GLAGQLAHHDATYLRPLRLHVLGVDTVVADHRSSHHYDLAQVARIGKGLLIARDVGGEYHFTEGGLDGARARARESGAVFEQHERGAGRHRLTPRCLHGITAWAAAKVALQPASWLGTAARCQAAARYPAVASPTLERPAVLQRAVLRPVPR